MTSVRELADQAGQAIRAANHLTITPHGDMSVPDLYRVVGELGYLSQLYVPGMKDNGVKRLSQTLNPEP